MKQYSKPSLSVYDFASLEPLAYDVNPSGDLVDEQWTRGKQQDDGAKKGIGRKLWDDLN